MATVEIDLLEGVASSHDIISGWDVTRVAIVTGLNAGGTLDSAGLLQAAENAVAKMTGPRGTNYGTSPSGAWVTGSDTPPSDWVTGQFPVGTYIKSFKVDPIGATAAKVKIIYHGYPLPRFEFDSSINEVPTNKDVNGNVVTLSYTYPNPYPLNPARAGRTLTTGWLGSRPVPESLWTVKYVITDGILNGMNATATNILTYYKHLLEGKINSSAYPVGNIPGARHCVLCEKVHGTSSDGGASYETSFVFHYRPTGWDRYVVIIDSDTGNPPSDLVEGTGSKTVQVYPETAFPLWTFGPN